MEPTDRDALSAAYEQLSESSRQRRFFSPPRRLSEAWLDYLTELDGSRHFALVAHSLDPEPLGLGVARWVRNQDDPTRADAAVTVVDAWQGRGLGSALLERLVAAARNHGITTFTADVLWDNRIVLDPLVALGARVTASEPGVASVELDLPDDSGSLHESAIGHFLARAAAD